MTNVDKAIIKVIPTRHDLNDIVGHFLVYQAFTGTITCDDIYTHVQKRLQSLRRRGIIRYDINKSSWEITP